MTCKYIYVCVYVTDTSYGGRQETSLLSVCVCVCVCLRAQGLAISQVQSVYKYVSECMWMNMNMNVREYDLSLSFWYIYLLEISVYVYIYDTNICNESEHRVELNVDICVCVGGIHIHTHDTSYGGVEMIWTLSSSLDVSHTHIGEERQSICAWTMRDPSVWSRTFSGALSSVLNTMDTGNMNAESECRLVIKQKESLKKIKQPVKVALSFLDVYFHYLSLSLSLCHLDTLLASGLMPSSNTWCLSKTCYMYILSLFKPTSKPVWEKSAQCHCTPALPHKWWWKKTKTVVEQKIQDIMRWRGDEDEKVSNTTTCGYNQTLTILLTILAS